MKPCTSAVAMVAIEVEIDHWESRALDTVAEFLGVCEELGALGAAIAVVPIAIAIMPLVAVELWREGHRS